MYKRKYTQKICDTVFCSFIHIPVVDLAFFKANLVYILSFEPLLKAN